MCAGNVACILSLLNGSKYIRDMEFDKKLSIIFREIFKHCHNKLNNFNGVSWSERQGSRNDIESNNSERENILTYLSTFIKLFCSDCNKVNATIIDSILLQTVELVEVYFNNPTYMSDTVFNQVLEILSHTANVAISNSLEVNIKILGTFYRASVEQIMQKTSCHSSNSALLSEELALRLKIVSVMYEAIQNAKVQNVNQNGVMLMIDCMKESDNLMCSDLFLSLIYSNSEVVAAQTLINVIPKYMNIYGNYILQHIWKDIASNVEDSSNSQLARIFIIMCYLSDFYFSVDSIHFMDHVINDNNYWVLLQKGFMNSDSFIKRQALFLMKASVEFLMRSGIKINCRSAKASQLEELNQFCILLEYLAEKQLHIVEPMFNQIESFIEKNGLSDNKLDICWVIVVLEKMLCHDNLKIIKLGLRNLMKIPIEEYSNEAILKYVIQMLLSSLNCTSLYYSSPMDTLKDLEHYFFICSESESGSNFFKLLIKEASLMRWSSETLFNVTYSLISIKNKNYWQCGELENVIKIVTSGTTNHYIFAKSGVECQLLVASTNLIDTDEVTLNDVANFLKYFDKNICLQRGSYVWMEVQRWISESYSLDEVLQYIRHVFDSLENDFIADGKGRMIVILYDVLDHCWKIDADSRFSRFFGTIVDSFSELRNRPYGNPKVLNFYLLLLHDIIEESKGNMNALNCLNQCIPEIAFYIEQKLSTVYHIRDLSCALHYIEILQSFIVFSEESNISPVVDKWWNEIITQITSRVNLGDGTQVYDFIRMKMLNLIVDYVSGDLIHQTLPVLVLYLKRELNSPLKKSEDPPLTRDLQVLWGKMNSEYIQGKWCLLSKIFEFGEVQFFHSESDKNNFWIVFLEGLEVGGYCALSAMFGVLKKVKINTLVDGPEFKRTIDAIWNAMRERKKNDDYHSLMETFVSILFDKAVVENANESVYSILLHYANQIYSENITRVVHIFMKQVKKLGYTEKTAPFLLEVLPRALLFGGLQKKDERLFSHIIMVMNMNGMSPLELNERENNRVRALAISIILKMKSENESHRKFSANLVEALINLEENINKNKIRYFANSYVHKVKQRLMQTLLLLEPYLPKEDAVKLWDWCSNKMRNENNQTSVRYLQEWLMTKLLYDNIDLMNNIWLFFDKSLEERTTGLCSFMSVVFQARKCIHLELVSSWIDRAVQTFFPYCMAQNFNIRLYAQVILKKLLDENEYRFEPRQEPKAIHEKYSFILNGLHQSISKGNHLKNSIKLSNDFYFCHFHPIEHYALDIILSDLPNYNVDKDEAFTEKQIKECEPNEESLPLKTRNVSCSIFSEWSYTADDEPCHDDVHDLDMEIGHFQRKIIPVKSLIPDWEKLAESYSFPNRPTTEKGGLIVVASLVERIPNLGGLSRTCEIFGASELVIGSLKYIEDKQFQSLSVTAEKWLCISEVKPYYLADYLLKMKRNGYVLLAAEQATNSKPLQSFKFPKKSLLLLGNEKKGIPRNILPLVDFCIEIPQKGIIRSLNVHVTGALFIWEYAKQHHFLS